MRVLPAVRIRLSRGAEVPLVASYAATTHFASPISPGATLQVEKDPTSTSMTLSSPSVTYGSEQTETFKVTATTSGGLTPTGSVKIKAASKILCTAKLEAGVGNCSLKAKTLPRGTYTVVGEYPATSLFAGSTTESASLTVF
jgi:hypothetical protein